MKYLIDIDEGLIRIKNPDGFIRTIVKEELYNFLNENREVKIYICSGNKEINKLVQEQYINVKLLDKNCFINILPKLNEAVLAKKPQQIMAANAVFNEYGIDAIIVNFENLMTIDTYNQQQYVSGVMYPGIDSHFQSFNQLGIEEIKFNEINHEAVIKNSEQIGKGIVNGYLGAIKTLIDEELNNYPWINNVIFTGQRVNNFIGYLNEQVETLNFNYTYEQNLIFKGMEYYINKYC